MMPTKKQILKFYEEEYPILNPSMHLEDSAFKVLEIYAILGGDRNRFKGSIIFDMGCGAGTIAKGLEKKLKANLSVGCDLSASIIKISRNETKSSLLLIGDCEQTPIRDKSINIVLMIDLIEHLQNPYMAIAEAARISARWIVIRIPIENCLYHKLKKSINVWLFEWKLHCGHLWKFNLSFIIKLLEHNNLKIIRVRNSRYPFSLLKGGVFKRVMAFLLPRIFPSRIYRRFFPDQVVILAELADPFLR